MNHDLAGVTDALTDRLTEFSTRLERIEDALALLVRKRDRKEWYSTAELAELLRRAEFTVREWCRLGRIHAQKRRCGRGRTKEWMVSHEELERVKNEGLLPLPRF